MYVYIFIYLQLYINVHKVKYVSNKKSISYWWCSGSIWYHSIPFWHPSINNNQPSKESVVEQRIKQVSIFHITYAEKKTTKIISKQVLFFSFSLFYHKSNLKTNSRNTEQRSKRRNLTHLLALTLIEELGCITYSQIFSKFSDNRWCIMVMHRVEV